MTRSIAHTLIVTTVLLANGLAAPVWAKKPAKKAPHKAAHASDAGVSAEEILKRSDEARMPDGTISFSVTVTDKDAEEVQGETTYRVSAKGEDLAMIETTAPARLKGRKLLMRGDDLWLYLPTVKRPTRVGLQQRLTGEVANGDIARTRFFVDYKPKKMGEEKIKGKTCHKLELKAKKKETTYRRILLWVETSTFQPAKAEFFALSGKLLKRSEYFDYQNVLGSNRATRVLIRDALKPAKSSELKYQDFKREQLDDSFFTKESLM